MIDGSVEFRMVREGYLIRLLSILIEPKDGDGSAFVTKKVGVSDACLGCDRRPP